MAKKKNYVMVMVLYLVGIFMGAIDTGIVTPAREIIQNQLGVDGQTGIWMITIYTLAYAASVPIMGKLADKFGRKYIYLACIFLFGFGSFLCGLSSSFGGFTLLIIARVVQAIGGGGIVPIATAEFGTTFPAEKRGMALGLVGGVYGIANVFGASAGSAILNLFGNENWKFIFFINIPISIFIVAFGIKGLSNNRNLENNNKIDIFGIFTLTLMVLSLLYGLKNLDFFDFINSIKDTNVYPFLIAFIVLVPFFILAEKKAEDPVISLEYFTNKNILITLVLSTISGFVMMGVIFVPQFSENCLKLPSGSGGYLVIILGLFAGVGAPVSGKLIDKFGPKLILGFGFACTILGALFMMLVTTRFPSYPTVLVGLALAGLGMGFTMGTPVNYMMLAETDPKNSNSALATLSLVRSVGTAIAPAIMVGFIVAAATNVQANIMAVMPSQIDMPDLPHMQEIEETLTEFKSEEEFAKRMEGMPDIADMKKIDMNFAEMSESNTDFEMPKEVLERLQASDVTTIVDDTKYMTEVMFDQMSPQIITKVQGGIDKGINGINSGIEAMEGMGKMSSSGIMAAMMGDSMKRMETYIPKMKTLVTQMEDVKEAIPEAFDKALDDYLVAIDKKGEDIEKAYQSTLNEGFKNMYLLTTITAALALVILKFYDWENKDEELEKEHH